MRDWVLIVGLILIACALGRGLYFWWRERQSLADGNAGDAIGSDELERFHTFRMESEARDAQAAPVGNRSRSGAQRGQGRSFPSLDAATDATRFDPHPDGAQSATPPILVDPIDQQLAETEARYAGLAQGGDASPEADASAASSAGQTSLFGDDGAQDTGAAGAIVPGSPIVRGGKKKRGNRKQAAADGISEPREQAPVAPPVSPDETITLRLGCKAGGSVSGSTILELANAHKLEFGRMNIFHRPSLEDPGRSDFSMASFSNPGEFDLSNLEDQVMPGVTLCMTLPGPANPVKAFESMVETAQAMADEIGAWVYDEDGNVMTEQNTEHYRQCVREFVRRQMLNR